jgi:hypothetical protein
MLHPWCRCIGTAVARCAVFLAVSCKHPEMASAAQCERLLGRFVDLALSEDPHARAMTSEDRARLRARIATEALSDGRVYRVKTQCESVVTAKEYKCAIAAPTSRAWNDCIQ